MDLHFCSSKEEALGISHYFSAGDVVLVKASRTERLEELFQSMTANWGKRVGENQ